MELAETDILSVDAKEIVWIQYVFQFIQRKVQNIFSVFARVAESCLFEAYKE